MTTPDWTEMLGMLEAVEQLIGEAQLSDAAGRGVSILNDAHRIVGACIRILVHQPAERPYAIDSALRRIEDGRPVTGKYRPTSPLIDGIVDDAVAAVDPVEDLLRGRSNWIPLLMFETVPTAAQHEAFDAAGVLTALSDARAVGLIANGIRWVERSRL